MTTNNNIFFDLITTGVCFINRLAWITPTQGAKYLVANICLLSGNSNNPTKVFASTRVKGTQANKFLQDNFDIINNAINNKTSVFARIQLGDIKPEYYHAKDEKRTIKCKLDARLIKISYMKIGDMVLNITENDEQNAEAQKPQEQAQAAPEAQKPQKQAQVNSQPVQMSAEQWEQFQAFQAYQNQQNC